MIVTGEGRPNILLIVHHPDQVFTIFETFRLQKVNSEPSDIWRISKATFLAAVAHDSTFAVSPENTAKWARHQLPGSVRLT